MRGVTGEMRKNDFGFIRRSKWMLTLRLCFMKNESKLVAKKKKDKKENAKRGVWVGHGDQK